MHTCTCGKTYKRLKTFQEHRALCEMLLLASEHESKDHLLETPSLIDMWLAMKGLIRKNAELEKKIATLQNWISTQKKKLSVIDWLNDHSKPECSYQEWVDTIILDENDLEMIFQHNFIGGMFHILSRQLPITSDIELPIKAFDQKINQLFIYKNKTWSIMDKDDFKKLVSTIHHKLHRVFSEYNKKNEDIINNFSKNDEWYKNVSKVMGGPLSYDKSVSNIHFKIYNYLKFNLKSVTTFEFTF